MKRESRVWKVAKDGAGVRVGWGVGDTSCLEAITLWTVGGECLGMQLVYREAPRKHWFREVYFSV